MARIRERFFFQTAKQQAMRSAVLDDRSETSGRGSYAPMEPYKPPVWMTWLYRRFFSHINVDEKWSEVVKETAARGTVVYVMRSVSWLDFLCLDFLLKRIGVAPIHFADDLGLWVFEPLRGNQALRFKKSAPDHHVLKSTLLNKKSALLFLGQPPRFAQTPRRGGKLNTDLFRTLIEVQRESETPLLLLPQTLVWTKLPPNRKRTLIDLLFGPSEWPGRIRVFFQFVRNYRHAMLRSGEPFDLKEFVEQSNDLSDERISEKVRYALLRRLERERSLVLGPTKKGPARMRQEILRSPRVQKQITATARAKNKKAEDITRQADRELRKLCAAPDAFVLGIIHRICDRIWNKIYDGLVVDQQGLERLREAAREGPLVLLPSHKSHIDYVVLDDVLYANKISVPLIAAGENLNFWPLGPILRRAGAFFIRRSFRGHKLYSALIDAYMRKLLVEGYNIEFFIEGGRSRTGKLLAPRLGLLSMVVDAAIKLRGKKIRFVPIYIGYERIIEQRSYTHEIEGGEKTPENIGGLLRTPTVLRSKYGRLYLQVGKVLDFDDALARWMGYLSEKGDSGAEEIVQQEQRPTVLPANLRRAFVQRFAHEVLFEINRVTTVTPASLVAASLLMESRRYVSAQDVQESCERLLSMLKVSGAPVSMLLEDPNGHVRSEAVSQALHLFEEGKLVQQLTSDRGFVFGVPEEKRTALDYYKNNIIHYFVPRSLLSAVLLANSGSASVELLRNSVRKLSRMFKYEFMFRADVGFDHVFQEILVQLQESNDIRVENSLVSVVHEQNIETYARSLRNFFESYRLALHGCERLLRYSSTHRDWLKKTLQLGMRRYLAGQIRARESISRPNLENALRALRDLEIVKYGDGGQIVAGEHFRSQDDFRRLDQELGAYIV